MKKYKISTTMGKKSTPVVIVLNRSWPAVSQICSLIRLPSNSMVLILKSMLQRSGLRIYAHMVFKLAH